MEGKNYKYDYVEIDEDGSDLEEKFSNRPDIEIEAMQLLEALIRVFPQTVINGANNIWIVKPAGLSRGRGIKIFASWAEISRQIKNKDCAWVVQKYIENPALIRNKKFDIRQWVLVTDWNPLTVWFYEECYIRFSAADFALDNIKNRFAHLTNNSVNKHSEYYCKPEDLFWTMENLQNYIKYSDFV